MGLQFPHCEARIVHAPGECEICDMYAPDLQKVREAWNIAFTGHKPKGNQTPCPADVARGPDSYNQWGGNVPQKGKVLGTDWAGYTVTESDPRLKKRAVGKMGFSENIRVFLRRK